MAEAQLHHALATQAGRARETAQSGPRPARIRMSVRTVGIGETRLVGRHALNFGASLLEEPSFTWGVQALGSIAGNNMPLCTAIVLRYLTGGTGAGRLYVGAEMGFRIDSDDSNITLLFSLTFEASTLRVQQ